MYEKLGYNSKSQMIIDLLEEKELKELLAELIQMDLSGLVDEIIKDLYQDIKEGRK